MIFTYFWFQVLNVAVTQGERYMTVVRCSDSQWRSSYTDRQCSTRHTASPNTNHAHTTSDMPPACLRTAAVSYNPSLWCEFCFHAASSKVGLHKNITPICIQHVNVRVSTDPQTSRIDMHGCWIKPAIALEWKWLKSQERQLNRTKMNAWQVKWEWNKKENDYFHNWIKTFQSK